MEVGMLLIPCALFAGFLIGWFGMYFKIKMSLKKQGIDVTIDYE